MRGFTVQRDDVVSEKTTCRARSGVISVEEPGGGSVVGLETPCFLLHTVRGCSPNVTWDGIERLHSTHIGKKVCWGIQADVLQMYVE